MSGAFHVKREPSRASRAARRVIVAPILVYRRVTPLFPRRCRYEPTCSLYAVEAIRELGVLKGIVLAAWRVLRCNPWSPGGIDPVTDRRLFRDRPAGGSGASAGTAGEAGP